MMIKDWLFLPSKKDAIILRRACRWSMACKFLQLYNKLFYCRTLILFSDKLIGSSCFCCRTRFGFFWGINEVCFTYFFFTGTRENGFHQYNTTTTHFRVCDVQACSWTPPLLPKSHTQKRVSLIQHWKHPFLHVQFSGM